MSPLTTHKEWKILLFDVVTPLAWMAFPFVSMTTEDVPKEAHSMKYTFSTRFQHTDLVD